jgi:large repetitive protein
LVNKKTQNLLQRMKKPCPNYWHSRTARIPLFLGTLLLAVAVVAPQTRAATATKLSTGTDLTAAASWSGGSGPGFPTSADVATWTSTSLGTGLTLGSAASWGSISVLGAAADISVTGSGTLTLASGISAASSTVNITFANPIALSASQTWNINASKSLTVSGLVSGSGFGISKDSGTGTLGLNNIANTYTGPVSVSAGTLQLGSLANSQTYAFTGNSLSVNGATLYFPGSSSGTYTHTYNFANLTGPVGVTSSTLSFQSNNSTTKSVNAALNFSGNNTVSYAGSSYTHNLNLNKPITGTGTLTFNFTASGTSPTRNVALASGQANAFTGAVILNTAAALATWTLSSSLGASSYEVRNSWTLKNNVSGGLDSASSITLVNPGSVLTLTQPLGNTSCALTVTAGTVNVGNTTSSIGNLSAAAGTIQGTGASSVLSVNQTTDGTCAANLTQTTGNALALVKTGSAKLTLNVANGYNGSTTINNGTLALGASGSISASPTITVASGATFDVSAVTGGYTLAAAQTLQGNGTVVGPATIAGLLSPGDSGIGTLAFSGTGALTLSGTNLMEVSKSGSTWTSDLVTKTGTINYNGSLIVTNISVATFAPGDKVTVFTGTSYSGGFASLTLPTLDSGYGWDTSKLTVDGSIQVVLLNGAPTAVADTATTPEDTLAVIPVLANDTDPENDTLVIQSVTQGAHGTVAIVGTNVTYMPATNWNGGDSFDYTITDGHGNTATASVAVTVTPVNDAPYFTSDPIVWSSILNDGQAITGSIASYATDVEGDTITFSKDSGPAWLTVDSGGTLSGTPAATDTGTNIFVVKAQDPSGAIGTAGLRIYVRTIVTSVVNGSWTNGTTWSDGLAPSSLSRYIVAHQVQSPDDNDHTFAGYSMTVTNGGRLYLYRSNSGTSINVYHRLPSLSLQPGATVAFSSSLGSIQHFMPNLVTVAGTVTFTNIGGGYDNNLTLSGGINGAGTVNYSVNRNGNGVRLNSLNLPVAGSTYSGNWVVSYTGGDDTAVLNAATVNALGTGTVTLNVRSTLVNSSANGLDSLTGVTLASSTAQLTLTYAWSDASAYLAVIIGSAIDLGSGASSVGGMSTNGTAVPAGTYAASDLTAWGLTASGTGTLIVLGAPWNQPVFTNVPVFAPDATQNAAYSASMAGMVTDADSGDVLTYSKVSGPSWLSVASDGTLSGAAANANVGTNLFTVRAADTHGLYKEGTLQVFVINVNDPPVANSAAYTRNVGSTLKIATSSLLNDYTSDPDGNDRILVAVGTSPNATITVDAAFIIYEPTNPDSTNADTFSYVVGDGLGLFATNLIHINVQVPGGETFSMVSAPVLVDNQFQVGFAGIPNLSYSVQMATNVSGPWTYFTNVRADALGRFGVVATNDPPAALRFFRTSYP